MNLYTTGTLNGRRNTSNDRLNWQFRKIYFSFAGVLLQSRPNLSYISG